ncbi:MAG: hypothetical protein CVV25_05730 [Ignavibacteriae bacterium HGW-Ignavibacteriae-4]|jgi:hypothetical protein|nr:MAG: hypothetical protein CVV25_05730 [Ignavibacteriae bacterium HGW-Ignavibacteriae-4]
MKKQLLTLTALLGLSLMLFSCSDDKTTSPDPDPTEDVSYVNSNITSYTYNEYDLDSENKEVTETTHQDSLNYEQQTSKDGKTADEYQVYTNVDGSYTSDGNEYYAGETNKLYAHLSVFQSMFANIEANGFSLESLFDGAGDWFLIADAKATKAWTLFNGTVTFDLPIIGPTDGDVNITMANKTTESIMINDKATSVDRYSYTANIKATTPLGPIDLDVTGAFWIAPNIGIIRSNVNSFTVPIAEIAVEGSERILVNYSLKTVEN